MAHVSAQTHDIAEYQVVLHATQQLQAQQQQLYTDAQVQRARAEAESRTEVLAEMIQATRIDPAAIEQHAISVANDVAQTQGRAVAEAHAAQHAKFSDIRMAEAFKQMEIQLHTRLEQQMREVPTAHMEQVRTEVRQAVEAQGQELIKLVQRKLDDFQIQTTSQLEHTQI
ncbi:hypothetical protein JG688_00016557 [Phytophthora aleatoria]|uniref:Uncharacterized protein n=1 Tax=Phytophthora aleatoria TaxID=2496075 RepID=A0A8J5M1Y8_9STRA|nr:hypothetical protein JG688_00016557 [Phytophthora aleatoria]